ncbi:DNA polymerase IV [Lolliginicoccus suaedae]|uniref:DNA polymerase IV n=1 Tax=Lolliginicoccus suaedae TaxID=2605429 RepID=UPI0011ED2913|nr:DNA polymerase IV [Lolliginicoccus suaedae]
MDGSSRWVLHLDMDAFFASVEQLARPTLRGRPVLVGGAGGRGVVAGASYEARVFGAGSAMPMHQARAMVGVTAVVLPPRGAVYSEASRRVFAEVREMIPVIEQLSLDEAFGEPAELRGATSDEVARYCSSLRDRVRERTGLEASVGAGPGKQIAKIASGMAKPRGQRVIAPAEQQGVLAPLPVRKLWGIGPVAEQRLRTMGITTIGELAAISAEEAGRLLGSAVGGALHELARGIDNRPVTERAVAKQVSAETTFARDLITRSEVRSAITSTGIAAHRRLERDGRGARTVTVKLRKADMSIHSRSSTLAHATSDKDILLGAAHKLAVDPATFGAIRLVGVSYSGLSDTRQEILFPELDATPPPDDTPDAVLPARYESEYWPGLDVHHPEHGHGWVQGCGHGVITVRFETRTTGPGPARTFPLDSHALAPADPLASLGWEPLPSGTGQP